LKSRKQIRPGKAGQQQAAGKNDGNAGAAQSAPTLMLTHG
jgi:hypothetical protein